MSIRTKLPVVIASAAAVAGIATSTAAYASDWYSSTSPLIAYEKGAKQAGAYGKSYIQDGSYARVNSHQKDFKPGGNSVYVDTDYKYWMLNSTYEMAWVEKASKETDRTKTGKWVADYTRHTLLGEADRVRMVSHVCEDQKFSGDPCSVNVIQTFNY